MNNGETLRRMETRLRDREIWRLRQEGLLQQEIADRVGMSQGAVCAALRRVSRQLAQEFAGDARLILAGHTERLEATYRESMAAWQKSRDDVLTETEEDSGGVLKSIKVRRTQHGDAGCLNAAMAALRDIRKLWGLDDAETVRAILNDRRRGDEDDAEG